MENTNPACLLRNIVHICLGLLFVFPTTGQAAPGSSRVAHFDSTGQNVIRTTNIFDSTWSSCVITITNASSGSTQTFTLNITATANGVAATGGSTVGPIDLASGATYTHWADYTGVPPSTTITQNLTCSGSITVHDFDSTLPGFIIATGTLGTFTENGHAQSTSASPGMDAKFRGSLSTSQIPITIGEGRPF